MLVVSVNDSSKYKSKEQIKRQRALTRVKARKYFKRYMRKMQNNWYKVEGNAIEGYVSGEYIKILTEQEYEAYSSKILITF